MPTRKYIHVLADCMGGTSENGFDGKPSSSHRGSESSMFQRMALCPVNAKASEALANIYLLNPRFVRLV